MDGSQITVDIRNNPLRTVVHRHGLLAHILNVAQKGQNDLQLADQNLQRNAAQQIVVVVVHLQNLLRQAGSGDGVDVAQGVENLPVLVCQVIVCKMQNDPV